MSSRDVDVTMSLSRVDVKTTMTSPRSGEDIETSLASTKSSTSSKNLMFEPAFSMLEGQMPECFSMLKDKLFFNNYIFYFSFLVYSKSFSACHFVSLL